MKTRIAAALSMVFLVAGCASGTAPQWTYPPAASQRAAALLPTDAPSSGTTASQATPSVAPGSLAPTEITPTPARSDAPASSATPLASSPAASSPVPAVAAVDPRRDGLEVGFGEWAVVPEAAAIRPGKVTFIVRNGGALTHGFELEREDGNGEELDVEGPEFSAGQTVEISATLEPGTYQLYCYIGDHENRGMTTRLVVRADAPFQTPPPPPTTAGGTIAISGFAFTPPVVQVAAGTEVTWQNQDPAAHTVTGDGGIFGSDTLSPGQRFSTRFDTPGTFAYLCAIHPAMRGTVEVR